MKVEVEKDLQKIINKFFEKLKDSSSMAVKAKSVEEREFNRGVERGLCDILFEIEELQTRIIMEDL